MQLQEHSTAAPNGSNDGPYDPERPLVVAVHRDTVSANAPSILLLILPAGQTTLGSDLAPPQSRLHVHAVEVLPGLSSIRASGTVVTGRGPASGSGTPETTGNPAGGQGTGTEAVRHNPILRVHRPATGNVGLTGNPGDFDGTSGPSVTIEILERDLQELMSCAGTMLAESKAQANGGNTKNSGPV